MTNPTIIRKLPNDGKDDDDKKEPETTMVAYIGRFECESADGVEKYVDLCKNHLFYSNYTEPEIAYHEMSESMRKVKELKLRKSEMMRNDLNDKMVVIMRLCILAFFENLKHRSDIDFNVSNVATMLENTSHMVRGISHAYFKTGLTNKLCVNNPRKIYVKCVEEHDKFITQCVKGEKKLSESELHIFAEALSHFTE